MKSLQKGNIQSITVEKEGCIATMFVEANPQYKAVSLYDGELKRLPKESIDGYLSAANTSSKDQIMTERREVEVSKLQVKDGVQDIGMGKEKRESNSEMKSQEQGGGRTRIRKEKSIEGLLPKKEGSDTKKGVRVN